MSTTMSGLPEQTEASAASAVRPHRRFLLVVAVTLVVGALLVAAAWLFLAPAVPEPTAAVPAAEPASRPEVAAETELSAAAELPSFEPEAARDPFSPVVPEPVQVAGGTDPAQPPPPTGDPNDQQPSDESGEDPATVEAPAHPVPAGCTFGEDVVCDGQLVDLIQIRDRIDGVTVATVQFGTSMYEAEAGAIVVEPLELLDIAGTCARLRYAGGEPFRLCSASDTLK